MHELQISDVRLTTAPAGLQHTGLIGWIAATVNGELRVDGLSLRRTLDGRLGVSYPARRDGAGREHPFVRPLSDTARRHVEHQILQALSLASEPAP